VAEAEARLSRFILETDIRDRDYYRQHLGAVMSSDRLIYINPFPHGLLKNRNPAERDRWRTSFVYVRRKFYSTHGITWDLN